MKSKKETFSDLMQSFQYRYDGRGVFDDFLTMVVCACSQNPLTGKSCDEDLYLEVIDKYKDDQLRFQFPKLFAALVSEMEERTGSLSGNDVLGNYFEQNFCRKGSGQFFTPWPVCELMAQCTAGEQEPGKTLRIADTACGSGRMLLAGAKYNGREHEYYGIDIDHTCVKMTALNLFLNGIFHAEAMCADTLAPGDFRVSYRTSFLPFGLFRIRDREASRLWHLVQRSLESKDNPAADSDLKLPSEEGDTSGFQSGNSQLKLF